jgi:hypothetical protein
MRKRAVVAAVIRVGAVYRAVAAAVDEDPPHAAIELYLMVVAR